MEYYGKKSAEAQQKIWDYIKLNNLQPGDRLPSENQLVEYTGLSRVTVRRALSALRQDGTIYVIEKKGSFLSEAETNYPAQIPIVLCHDEGSSRIMEIFKGAQDYLSTKGSQAIFSMTNRNSEQERAFISDFYNKGARCMIVIPNTSDQNVDFYFDMMQAGVQFVFIDKKPMSLSCSYIHSDNFAGGYLATKHLLDAGHTSIAFFHFEDMERCNSVNDRYQGYLYAHRRAGVPVNSDNFVGGENIRIEDIVQKLFERKEPPTAIFCINDMGAIDIANVCAKRRISVPGQLAIVGYDNISSGANHYPSISTVDQPFYELGYCGAETAYKLFRQGNRFLDIALPVTLIARESSQPAASEAVENSRA